MSRKASQYNFRADHFETKQCTWTGNWLSYANRNLQSAGRLVKKGDLDFSEVTSVNLDEYKGLPGTNDQSYYYFMHQHLFDQVNIQERHTHLPNGMEPDSKKNVNVMRN